MSKPHVPAWKRVGLKLKYAEEENRPAETNGRAESKDTDEPPVKKRRVVNSTASKDAVPRTPAANDTSNTVLSTKPQPDKPKKQVSFTTDTKTTDSDTAVSIIPSEAVEEAFPQAESSKKSKKPKQPTQPSSTKTQTTLDYLVHFYKSHSAWKFNKNREIWILKHAFSTSDIPLAFNLMLAQYIHGLKSVNTRDRLRQECNNAGPDQVLPGVIPEDAKDALTSFPGALQAEDSALCKELQKVSRPRLIMWALDPTGEVSNGQQTAEEAPASNGVETGEKIIQKKRKNRTAVVEYSSSSSSESETERHFHE